MNILVSGGTGFIGSHLIKKLVQERHHLYVLTRHPKQYADTEFISYISFNYPMKKLPIIHAVINLAGESLYGYWSEKKKQAILTSRVKTTEKMIELLKELKTKPEVFISGSAVGYYGTSEEIIFTEKTLKSGNDFLANVTEKWEAIANIAEDFGIRTVYARFGVVLDRSGGALPLMALPVRCFVGGNIGNGKQWVSWIHIDDCVNSLHFALENEHIAGALNVTAPNPLRNTDFTKELALVLKRPAIVTTPASVLRIALGGMHMLITKGQYVYPQKLLDQNFSFQYPHLDSALREIFQK